MPTKALPPQFRRLICGWEALSPGDKTAGPECYFRGWRCLPRNSAAKQTGIHLDPASASVLFDEQQVQQVYDRVSPAVVEIIIDNEIGGAFAQTGFGSGFLIGQEGHIATNNHVIEGDGRVRVKILDGSYATATV